MFKLATLTELRELQERMSVEQRKVHADLVYTLKSSDCWHVDSTAFGDLP